MLQGLYIATLDIYDKQSISIINCIAITLKVSVSASYWKCLLKYTALLSPFHNDRYRALTYASYNIHFTMTDIGPLTMPVRVSISQ